MAIWIAATIYAVFAGIAVVLTLNEQLNRRKSMPWRVLGVVACMFWPLTIAAMLCTIVVQAAVRKRSTQDQISAA